LGIDISGKKRKKAASFKGKTGIEKIYRVNDIFRNFGMYGPGPG